MIYGLPYKGSKNAIAQRIVDLLPDGNHFVDCCCGGGAILQAAKLADKYKTVTGYDINKAIVELIRAVMIDFDKIDYENFQVVSKEKFYECRDRNETLEDFIVRYVASFGFNGMEYLWGQKRVEYKMLMHNIITLPTVQERRLALRKLMVAISKGDIPKEDLENLCHQEQAQNLNRFKVVEDLMKATKTRCKMEVAVGSMFDINFEKYDVLYFDPPYSDTKGYNGQKFSSIMFKTLLTVLKDSGKQVFVSEYTCPCEGYTEIASFRKTMTQDAYKNTHVTEKLWYSGTLEQYASLPGITGVDKNTDQQCSLPLFDEDTPTEDTECTENQ